MTASFLQPENFSFFIVITLYKNPVSVLLTDPLAYGDHSASSFQFFMRDNFLL